MSPSTRPNALIVMKRSAFDAQFDAERLDRLDRLTSLPEPIWTNDLADPSLRSRLAETEVLVTGWGAPRLDAEVLESMPRLTALFHCAGTIRGLVSESFWDRKIIVSNSADANAVPVAEYTLAAILFAGKKAPFLAQDARVHREDWSYVGGRGDLSNRDRTIGVVGFSRVGRRVVKLVQQLENVTCLVADPYAVADEVEAAGGRLVSLDDLLPAVDVLSIHAPELESTRNMIGEAQLAALHDGATLINTARGSLVDTAALERACATGRISAILDVTYPEPLPSSSRLYDLPNVMITPHVAGSLGSEIYRMTDNALDEIERYTKGLPLHSALSNEDLRLSA